MTTSKLERLLAPGALRVLFQPVVELRDDQAHVHYLEALVRGPAGTTLERADVLFDYVRLRRAEPEIDRACATAVLEAAREVPEHMAVGLNIHAATLSRDSYFPALLEALLERHGLAPGRLVLEIVEHAPRFDAVLLDEALDRLHRCGVRVALDDVGHGESTYAMMIDVAPDYFKIDRSIVHGCHHSVRRLAVLESVALLATRFGAQAVVEGVEMAADLAAARGVGVDLVQGYLFCKAIPAHELPSESELTRRAAQAMAQPHDAAGPHTEELRRRPKRSIAAEPDLPARDRAVHGRPAANPRGQSLGTES